jgi:hypothetical protein
MEDIAWPRLGVQSEGYLLTDRLLPRCGLAGLPVGLVLARVRAAAKRLWRKAPARCAAAPDWVDGRSMGDDREAGLIWLQEDQAPVLMRVTVMLTPLCADDPRLPGSVTTLLPRMNKA